MYSQPGPGQIAWILPYNRPIPRPIPARRRLPNDDRSTANEMHNLQAVPSRYRQLGPPRALRNLAIVLDRDPITLQFHFHNHLGEHNRRRQVGEDTALTIDYKRKRHDFLSVTGCRTGLNLRDTER